MVVSGNHPDINGLSAAQLEALLESVLIANDKGHVWRGGGKANETYHQHNADPSDIWDIPNGIFFAITVVTTIGKLPQLLVF